MRYSREFLDQYTVLKVVTGSTAQGTAIEGKSDLDIKAVVNLPLTEHFTLEEPWETETFSDPDMEYHSVKKLLKMLCKQNPTALEILCVEDKHILHQGVMGGVLRAKRHLFFSKKAYKSFYGYAHDQLMRIKNALSKSTDDDLREHIKYTLERMVEGFAEKYHTVAPNSYRFEVPYVALDTKTGKPQISINAEAQMVDLQLFHGMVSELNATYKNYKKAGSRNVKATPEKLWKHASHLVRLILTCKHLLLTGEMQVCLYDHLNLLMQIKQGQMSWEELFDLVNQLRSELDEAYKVSTLPEDVDYGKINALYTDLMIGAWGK